MNKKGISLATLAIAIIVLMILISTVVIYSIRTVGQIEKAKFVSEYYRVQDAVNEYYTRYDMYPVLTDRTIMVSSTLKASQFFEENGISVTGRF